MIQNYMTKKIEFSDPIIITFYYIGTITPTNLYELCYCQSMFVDTSLKNIFWYHEDIDLEGKIWFDGKCYRLIKNKHAFFLNDYINTCDPEEATYLKLKYL